MALVQESYHLTLYVQKTEKVKAVHGLSTRTLPPDTVCPQNR